RITLLSGEDALNLPLYTAGARGAVSVVSNVAPALTQAVWRAYTQGDLAQAAALHAQFVPLAEALFSEPNPIPAKAALAMLGAAGRGPALAATTRLPLCPMSTNGHARLRSLLVEMELL